MTALQLQRLLDRAGLSQRGAAKVLEINERTMRKYCSGDAKIPKTVELALYYLTQTYPGSAAQRVSKP
jgi:plasmid maintenance system antidote protein VapI